MAKNKVTIDVEAKGKGFKKVAVESKQAGEGLDKAAAGAGNYQKREKGVAGASSNSTKNFSKMAQGISGGLVPAYATLAANVFAISAAFNFLKNASDLSNLIEGQTQYAQQTGLALQSVTARLRDASNGMLGFREAAQAAAIGVAKGFSPAQMEELASGATKVSQALGRDFEDSFDRLVRGVSKAEPELLDELGITLRLETATKNYATAIGKTADTLTAAERSQAVYRETLRQLKDQYSEFEGAPNPFTTLSKTFQDIVNTITQFFQPAFEKIAEVISSNGLVALAFFGTIAVGILKSMPFVESLSEGMENFGKNQDEALKKAKDSLDEYKNKLASTESAIQKLNAKGAKGVSGIASGMVEKGSTSPTLQRAAAGTMTGRDKANLSKALKSAEAQYKKHGKIVTGIFAGEDIKRVRNMNKSFGLMTKASASAAQKIRSVFGKGISYINVALKWTGVQGAKAFRGIARAATVASKAMNAAMKATVIIGTIQMIYDAFMAIVNAPVTVVKNIDSMINFIAKGVAWLVNKVIGAINIAIEAFNKIPGLGDIGLISEIDTTNMNLTLLSDTIGYFGGMEALQGWQKQRQAVIAFEESLESAKDAAKDALPEMRNIAKGITGNFNDGSYIKAGIATATAVGSLNMSGVIADLTSGLDKDQAKKVVDTYLENLRPVLRDISPKMLQYIEEGNMSELKNLEDTSLAYTANLASLKDGIANIATQITPDNLLGAEIFLKNLKNTADSAEEQAYALGEVTNAKQIFEDVFKDAEGSEAFLNNLTRIRQGLQENKDQVMQNTIASNNLSMLPPNMKAQLQERLTLESQSLTLSRLQLEVDSQRAALKTTQDAAKIILITQQIDELTRQQAVEQAKYDQNKKQFSDIAEIGMSVGNSLESSMTSAFDGLIQGTLSVKDAFANMAKSILTDLAKVIAKMLTMRLLESAFGGTSFGSFLGVPGGKTGGVFSQGGKMPGYATGGIAKGANSGYPAVLHGTEAVVPLPNGKSIPVDMKGAGQNNNVTVNVSVDGNGRASSNMQQDSNQAANLGAVIAKAVQQELQNQKRSGGILNPYGVA